MSYGVYLQRDTFAHSLDPRAKICFVVAFLIAAFLANGWLELGFVAVVAAGMLAAAGIGARRALRTLRPFVWIMAFVMVFNSVFSAGGVIYAAQSVARFALVLLGSSTLMATTSPTELTDATSMLLLPLRRLGVRVDDTALSVSMTLRFVPVVLEEFKRVKAAQEARLARFDQASPLARARAYVPVMVPLFAGALRRSQTLALAIRNREYGECGRPRTCIRAYSLGARDHVVLAAAVLLLTVILL
ncbi:energy-coupling factor transporter transmembrane component T [Paratractidigestivibacter sp.]|uniref:energy-coupling factor transporter transmembrane component T family protein n=1 Tax=Paratractidigestivibacter sp. TaxID=2847316 RepID=UPI002ABE80A6|nr:energy-coupling factor transporter transmembrane component T [Paratractidigestivibacter sp.]